MINDDGTHMISHKMVESSVIQNLELVFTSDDYEGVSTLSLQRIRSIETLLISG